MSVRTRSLNKDRTQLSRLLSPTSIAVVGASADRSKRGYQVLSLLAEGDFTGPIYPVNPRGGEIRGMTVIRDINGLPCGVDVVLIALPGRLVPQALRDLAVKDVGGAVVFANGFLEAGAEGASLNAELSSAINDTGIRVIGPNTSGILNVELDANLVGMSGVEKGPISVVTQSGNMWLSLVADNTALRGPGFQYYIGLGNQVDVTYDECLSFLADDDGTGVIAIYAEGLQDGRAFLAAASEAAMKCPIVMLRGGRSEIGQRTALSHTGSITGSDAVATDILRQAGIELVDRSDELATIAGALALASPIEAGKKVVILSDGGGHATIAADALSKAGLELSEISHETQARLQSELGASAEVANPIDVAGATDTNPSLFADCVEILMADGDVGLVFIVGLFGGYHLRFDPNLEIQEDETASRILDSKSRHDTPLLVQSCYAFSTVNNHDILREGGVPVFTSVDHAARAVVALSNRGRWLNAQPDRASLQLAKNPTASMGDDKALDEPSARRLLERAGITTGHWTFAGSADEVRAAVSMYGCPCAVKVVSPEVIHKSDAGGIQLNVTSERAQHAWECIVDSVMSAVPDAVIRGMIVTPMLRGGLELLIGATRDPIFGPIVVFGTGGTLVEALGDVSFRAAPCRRAEALAMIGETGVSKMLDGYRGLPKVNKVSLADLLVRIGDFVVADHRVVELDLNPIIASETGLIPVDARIVLSEES